MALYRCAACGSPNVVIDTQVGGVSYNYKKGIVGTAILGVGGAVAGIQSQNKQVYVCPDCGTRLTYPMPPELAMQIDIGVMSALARDRIQLRGMPLSWEYLKKKYINIEEGYGDVEQQKLAEEKARKDQADAFEKERKQQLDTQKLDEYASAASEAVVKYMTILNYELSEDLSEEALNNAQNEWLSECAPILSEKEARRKEETSSIEAHFMKLINEAHRKQEELLSEIDAKNTSLITDKKRLEETLTHLNIFKVQEKKNIKQRLMENDAEISKTRSVLESAKKDFDKQKENLTNNMKRELDQVQNTLETQFILPESPVEKKARLDEVRKRRKFWMESDNEISKANGKIKDAILIILEACNVPMSARQVQAILDKINVGSSEGRTGALLRQIKKELHYVSVHTERREEMNGELTDVYSLNRGK